MSYVLLMSIKCFLKVDSNFLHGDKTDILFQLQLGGGNSFNFIPQF